MGLSIQKKLPALAAMGVIFLSSCASVVAPDARTVDIPSPVMADQRRPGINERPDSVMYLPLGEDVLVPEINDGEDLPKEIVGPYELRGETLAGALQLILADYDISIAFETQEGLTRRITVANMRGELGKVVHQLCSLANLYCSYESGTVTIKDRQTFTVTLPPLGGGDDAASFLDDVASGLGAILNEGGDGASSAGGTSGGSGSNTPIVDPTTRTIIYTATQRTADMAARYFQRLRANTAMIVFETYIWEVSLNAGNSMGVDWSKMLQFGKFNTGVILDGTIGADFTNPVSIGIPTTADFTGTSGDLIQFLSQFGAVKTISQPQITVLSGSEAELRVADTQNYVSQIATTLSEGQATTSVNTDSVDTGFTLSIGSSWDKSTVYANVEIELTDVKQIDNFAFSDTNTGGGTGDTTQTRIQLPQTSERQLATQIRVRPGDSVLIAGLVRENDNFNKRGPGIMEPIIPDSRTAQTENLELVVLLRPRVIVYTAPNDPRYVDFLMKKHRGPGIGPDITSPQGFGQADEYTNRYEGSVRSVSEPAQEGIAAGIASPLTPEPMAVPMAPVAPAANSLDIPSRHSPAVPVRVPDPVVMKAEPPPQPAPIAPESDEAREGLVDLPVRVSEPVALDMPDAPVQLNRSSAFSSGEYAAVPPPAEVEGDGYGSPPNADELRPPAPVESPANTDPGFETYDQYGAAP